MLGRKAQSNKARLTQSVNFIVGSDSAPSPYSEYGSVCAVAPAANFIRLRKPCSAKGALLFELLVVIAVLAIVGTLGAHAIYLSMASDKRAGEKVAGLGLLEEGSAQVEAIAAEKWQNIFLLLKNTNYYATQSGGKWITATGTGTTTLNSINYLRNFVLQNVCRTAAKTITGTTDSNGAGTTCTGTVEVDAYDPSTQKVIITVNWTNGVSLALPVYVTRWPNKVCTQTAWSTGGSSGVKSCPDSTYAASTNITSGTSLQLCSGGC